MARLYFEVHESCQCYFFSILSIVCSHAQVSINGHRPFYDVKTQSLLFVTDSSQMRDFKGSVVILDEGWKQVEIDGKALDGVFSFGDVSEGKTFMLSAVVEGQRVSRSVSFTSLPVLSISKSSEFTNDYEPASIVIDSPDGSFSNESMSITVKHRGGSTNMPDRHKRNYAVKIVDEKGKSKDVSFFGMREDNKWILDAGQIDLFRMRNRLCHSLWLDFSAKPYYVSEEPKMVNGCRNREVEVFVNNEYRGIYNLMEPLDRKQLKLKKYKDKDGVHGLLYKTESWHGTKFDDGKTPYDNGQVMWEGWEAKYPEPGDDADTTDYKPLMDMITFLDLSSDDVFRKEIADRVDLPVFIDYVLFVNLINAFDNVGKNMYWSVYDKTSEKYDRLVPTPWDLDATFGQFYDNKSPVDSSVLRPTMSVGSVTRIEDRLLEVLGSEYVEKLEGRYAELRKTWFSRESLSQRFETAFEEIKTGGAAKRETEKWSGDTDLGRNELDFGAQLQYIKNWTAARLAYLDEVYHYNDITGITHVSSGKPSYTQGQAYNLQGQKVSNSYKGVVIKNGMKYYQR